MGYRRAKHQSVSSSGEEYVIFGQEGLKMPSAEVKLTVGDVEKLTGTSRDTLRFYDDKELLCPARTGEGTANNRKLYDAEDLNRLQAIQTLRAYDFGLDEIKRILDDGADIYEMMAEKLAELKLQEAHLRSLIFFAKFVNMADSDLIEGLANGPEGIGSLADHARTGKAYEEALKKLDAYSEEKAAEVIGGLFPAVSGILLIDEAKGFKGVEESVDMFFAWWDAFVVPIEAVGFIGFWALFEDQSLIAEYIERTFHSGSAGFIQMFAFFVLLVRLAEANDGLISEIAEIAKSDIVAAIEKSKELIDSIWVAMFGASELSASSDDRAEAAGLVLFYIGRALEDPDFSGYLGLADKVSFGVDELEKTLQVLAVMGG